MRSTALVGAIALGLMGAADASATFPGRDGRIAAMVAVRCDEYAGEFDPCLSEGFNELVAVAPGGHGWRSVGRWPCRLCFEGGLLRARLAYSPDGRRMVVEAFGPAIEPATTPSSQVAILAIDGSSQVRLAVPGLFAFPTSWLPDGRRVAVFAPAASGASGHTFVLGADDGAVREVTGGPRGEREWSSRGGVAVSHARGIYVWNLSTGRRRLILASSDRVTYTAADWSPDGGRLAVLRTEPLTRLQAIVTVAADGDDRRVVVRGPVPGCELGPPVWSPSGKRIAFTAGCLDPRSAGNALFTVRPSGARLRTVFEVDPLIPKPGSFVAGVGPAVAWQPLSR
jgi:Tol biopolymer transport system component